MRLRQRIDLLFTYNGKLWEPCRYWDLFRRGRLIVEIGYDLRDCWLGVYWRRRFKTTAPCGYILYTEVFILLLPCLPVRLTVLD